MARGSEQAQLSPQCPPVISVIVTAYNIANHIDDCLSSLLVSEVTDYEIIVVDDGSTDATLEVIASINDPRLRVIQQTNGGPGKARNTGLDAASGKYLLFVDGDDWVEPELIPQCLAHIHRQPETELFVFDYVDVTDTGDIHRSCERTFWEAKSAPWNKLYSSQLIASDRFDEDIWYEDLATVRPWVARASRIAKIDATLYNYRFTRPGSIMNSHDIQRFLDLPTATNRCVARIEADAAQGRTSPPKERLGADWKARLITVEAFILGVITRGQQIPDRHTRTQYVEQFIKALSEPEYIDIDIIARDYGQLVATASRCHRAGAHAAGDLLLHRLGELKRTTRSRLRIGTESRERS